MYNVPVGDMRLGTPVTVGKCDLHVMMALSYARVPLTSLFPIAIMLYFCSTAHSPLFTLLPSIWFDCMTDVSTTRRNWRTATNWRHPPMWVLTRASYVCSAWSITAVSVSLLFGSIWNTPCTTGRWWLFYLCLTDDRVTATVMWWCSSVLFSIRQILLLAAFANNIIYKM